MTVRTIVMACSMLAFFSTAALTRPYMVLGSGTQSCGKWIAERRAKSFAATVYGAWIDGYVTAINAQMLKKYPDISAGTDPEGIFAWVDNYCQANPLDNLAAATNELVDELIKKSGAF